jgi:hypothetical protein
MHRLSDRALAAARPPARRFPAPRAAEETMHRASPWLRSADAKFRISSLALRPFSRLMWPGATKKPITQRPPPLSSDASSIRVRHPLKSAESLRHGAARGYGAASQQLAAHRKNASSASAASAVVLCLERVAASPIFRRQLVSPGSPNRTRWPVCPARNEIRARPIQARLAPVALSVVC